jgi:hypothetical protein
MRISLLLFLIIQCLATNGQGGWTWTVLNHMPESVTNNAVTSAVANDTTYVYSFFGIDSTKQWSGMHSKAFRYNTISQVWNTLPPVPDSLGGVIAASASTLQNKIYIVGGYKAFEDGHEESSHQLHIFDPVNNTYTLGANIPIEIDDHVHLTYGDSLIYIITGWTSSAGNFGGYTNAVQIYNVNTNTWTAGTSVPNTTSYTAFGATGALIGNNIYYIGGARSSSFTLTNNLRKGIINPNDPTDITWSIEDTNPGDKIYRGAAIKVASKLFCIGGSATPYNYDGLAYSDGSGVEPTFRILEYNSSSGLWGEHTSTPVGKMDLRGLAKIDNYHFIQAGGMEGEQVVSNRAFLLTFDPSYISITDSLNIYITNQASQNNFRIYPNPVSDFLHIEQHFGEKIPYQIYDANGSLILIGELPKGHSSFSTTELSNGIYTLKCNGIQSRFAVEH